MAIDPPHITSLAAFSDGEPFTFLVMEQMAREESRKRIPRLKWYEMLGGPKLTAYRRELERHHHFENQCNVLWNSMFVRLMKAQVDLTLQPFEQEIQRRAHVVELQRQREFFEQVTSLQLKQIQEHEVRMAELEHDFQLRLLEATPDKTDPVYVAGRRREAHKVYTAMIDEVMKNDDLSNEQKRREVKLIMEMATK